MPMTAAAPVRPATPPPAAAALRYFGRFQLLRLLGKSGHIMSWLVSDPRTQQELMLVLPRTQAPDASALERWHAGARKASRLSHPGLAPALEVGEHDRWPYLVYERREASTWAERIGAQGLPTADLARWSMQALEGLAFAHEAGAAHRDLQPWLLLVDDAGGCRVMGLEAAWSRPSAGGSELDSASLQAQRRAAERDVLAMGLLMHHGLAGAPALDEPDVGKVIELMPPIGRDLVRLPWALARPVAEPLRAIVNRATDRQERQRYRSARTLARALSGWLKTDAEQGGGPIALLLDRLHSVGLLPAMPGAAQKAARMALMERERTNELAELVIEDPALSFELMRAVNTASVRGSMVAGNGPILTMRRAIAMLGLEGVRRCALALRAWPGPLDDGAAEELRRLVERVRLAGRIAVSLRPAGYDAEVVTLVAMLQNLGRLMVQYHFPDEAGQIRRLMQPAPPARPGEAEEPGMSEEGASHAVLGTDIEALGAAVARSWGLDEAILHMVRRQPPDAPVRSADTDDDLLRLSASCANEVVDALQLGATRALPALTKVAQRYARVLGVTVRDLQLAAQGLPPDADADRQSVRERAGGAG